VGIFIRTWAEAGNNVKVLETRLGIYPLCFYALIYLSGTQIFVLFGAPARPVNHYSIDFFARPQAECNRQFRLGKVAGASSDDPGLRLPLVENAD